MTRTEAMPAEESFQEGQGRFGENPAPKPKSQVVRLKPAKVNRVQLSQVAILEAALQLFSTQGYHGTSIREIAAEAGVSTGNVYHHFPDKETLFKSLLDQYWDYVGDPSAPFNKALAEGAFPFDLEKLAQAAEQSARTYRRHMNLIYVDVVEFQGTHLRKYFSEMPDRFHAMLSKHYPGDLLKESLAPECTPKTAVMLACRVFLQYFAVEILFGVTGQFGLDTATSIAETANILRYGMLRPAEPTALKVGSR